MRFGLNLPVLLVAGERKGRATKFSGQKAWFAGWAWVGAPAIPERAQEGGGGIWRRHYDWSQAVKKRNSGTRGSGVEA